VTQRKSCLTVSLDPELVDAANRAVTSGATDSVSAWVSAALIDRAQRDEQSARMSDVVDAAVVVLAADGNEIIALDLDELETLAASAGRHVELIRP